MNQSMTLGLNLEQNLDEANNNSEGQSAALSLQLKQEQIERQRLEQKQAQTQQSLFSLQEQVSQMHILIRAQQALNQSQKPSEV